MAHRITAPAIQRAQRLLDQRVAGLVHVDGIDFAVEATEETFDPVPHGTAIAAPRAPFVIGSKWGVPWHSRWFRLTATVPDHLAGRHLH
ncbi:MAG: hypothetical protein RJA51_318, partial [Actinomycetota bacterium]